MLIFLYNCLGAYLSRRAAAGVSVSQPVTMRLHISPPPKSAGKRKKATRVPEETLTPGMPRRKSTRPQKTSVRFSPDAPIRAPLGRSQVIGASAMFN